MLARIARTAIYLSAEFIVVYTLIVGAAFAFFYFATDFRFVIQMVFGLFALACVPLSAILVAFGPALADGFDSGDLSRGFYQPLRPLAALRATKEASRSAASGRPGVTLTFDDNRGISAIDVVDALERELDAIGIECIKLGGLTVHDDGSTWGVVPSLSTQSLVVWVESTDRGVRRQIVDGVKQFSRERLGLEIAS